jgi:hypothetical protein
MVQDYDRHKDLFQPEVVDSRVLSRHENDFKIYLRLLKKKVITVVLNTEHEVTYTPLGKTRARSVSRSTRIAEVENPGKPNERELPPGTGQGFLWRLNSYWRFEERDGGTWVECEAISLTRDIPTGLNWIVQPIIRDLPKESLENTLSSTRAALVKLASEPWRYKTVGSNIMPESITAPPAEVDNPRGRSVLAKLHAEPAPQPAQ